MVPQGKLLGHIVCKGGLKTDPDKIGVIVNMENPTNVTGVKSFVGHVGDLSKALLLAPRQAKKEGRAVCMGYGAGRSLQGIGRSAGECTNTGVPGL